MEIAQDRDESRSPVKVVIAAFSVIPDCPDGSTFWATHPKPQPGPRCSLFEQRYDWGFHIYSIGVHLLDKGLASEVEYWDYYSKRSLGYLPNGVLRVNFLGQQDVFHYLDRYGEPDLFVNYGPAGRPVLERLEGRSFRVHVPCLRRREEGAANFGAECYLVDGEEFLDDRSMMYVPVVNTRTIRPISCEKRRDFVYLAANYRGKRHDLLLDSVRGTTLTGHLHPVDSSTLDLRGTRVTATGWDETDVVELLQTSRIAVYPADRTSNPAAMWECVAAGLPLVVNADLAGGKHVVVPGVTGELAAPDRFREVMQQVLANRDRYHPREHLEKHWDTVSMLESYLAFFTRMGWTQAPASPAG